jgi:hypothetical protein
MTNKEERTSIINSISDWLKLLALIVLVAEVVVLAAMLATPSEKPIYIVYPVVMILLLVVVIVAVFFDRYLERKSKELVLKVEDKEVLINTSESFKSNQNEGKGYFQNNLLGYSFFLPKANGWNKPQEISYTEFFSKLLVSKDIDEEKLKSALSVTPFGNMQFNSKIIEIQYGEDLTIELDDQSTTDSVELQIEKIKEIELSKGNEFSEEETTELRKKLNQTDGISKLGFAVKMTVMVMDKGDYIESPMKLNLPNIFTGFSLGSPEPIDSLSANEDSILWTVSSKLKNVLIGGNRYNSMHIYRMYHLLENQKNIYLSQVQWSPQSDSAVSTWDSLKKMFESFKIQQ